MFSEVDGPGTRREFVACEHAIAVTIHVGEAAAHIGEVFVYRHAAIAVGVNALQVGAWRSGGGIVAG